MKPRRRRGTAFKKGDRAIDKVTGQNTGILLVVRVRFHRERDGRWIADTKEMPGVTAYGATKGEAFAAVRKLALEVINDRLHHGEDVMTGRSKKPARPAVPAPFRLEITPARAVAR